MMDAATQVVARLAARSRGRAVVIADTASIAPDGEHAVGIAAIKIVTEEVIQALAFGPMGEIPQVIARVHPMSRDAADLEPFAAWLIATIESAVARDGLARIWVPHKETMELLAILGHRYRSNREASERLRRMGELCLLLAEETLYAGQQVIVDAASLLRSHVVTGQMPAEDGHLLALLAWLNPEPGRPAAEVAVERARIPLSSTLANTRDHPEDARIEALRREWKRSTEARRPAIEGRIVAILTGAVLREWVALTEARAAFHRLNLPTNGEIGELVTQSRQRIAEGFDNGVFLHSSPHMLSAELDELEEAQNKFDGVLLAGDAAVRRLERERGRVLEGIVTRLDQPRRNFNPCSLEIETIQRDVRMRVDKAVRLVGGKVTGVVRELRSASPDHPGTIVRIELTNGVRGAHQLLGTRCEWIESNAFSGFKKRLSLKQARSRNSWLLFGARPPPSPRELPAGDLLDLVNGTRRRS
jgi:hypothetical protein